MIYSGMILRAPNKFKFKLRISKYLFLASRIEICANYVLLALAVYYGVLFKANTPALRRFKLLAKIFFSDDFPVISSSLTISPIKNVLF